MTQAPSPRATMGADIIRLHADDVSVYIDLSSGTPIVAHWGVDLGSVEENRDLATVIREGAPHCDIDDPQNPGIWRESGRGFLGRPALSGHRAGLDFAPMFTITSVTSTAAFAHITSVDAHAQLQVEVEFELTEQGMLLISQQLTNLGSSAFELQELTTWLPLPDQVTESMDFSGRWVKERQPQRRDIQVGTWARESREGRSGHDYTIIQMGLTAGADYQRGDVYSLGLLWSGNNRHLVERQPTGRTSFGAGELLLPGELMLEAGETYVAPSVAAAYSNQGFDGITDRYYRWLRSRANHPTNVRPRPLTLNVWEAVYMNHNLEKLIELADVAQSIGVERFVLDDGWFGARRDDYAGLGDWVVSEDAWPNGLQPLIDAVTARGMEFGLWFEGEMLNMDSDLYREHPEWLLHIPGRIPLEGRHQHLLDITHPGAFEHVLTQVDALLSEYAVSYIKWDHNKFLIDPGHLGRAAVHNQALAIYRLFDELKLRHPHLEIESCASGGGRIDLGMAHHVDRFWASDTNDALERQYIQRYTQFAIPPEMIGSHIGPTHSHTTHRVHHIAFRAITALFGHAGIEWDITQTTPDERAALGSWVSYYRANRDLLHSGRMVRIEQPDDTTFVHGVVAPDCSRAIFAFVALRAMKGTKPTAFRLTGLDADASYRVRFVEPAGAPQYIHQKFPAWMLSADGVTLTGAALAAVGLRPPLLAPETAFLVEVERLEVTLA